MRLQARKIGLVRFDGAPLAMEPQDFGRTLKRAEHDHDAAVFAQVRDGLDAAAENVEIGDRARSKNPKSVQSLRRKVDVAIRVEGRCRHKKHRLRLNEAAERFVDLWICFRHGYP